jgi:hypothetical protein
LRGIVVWVMLLEDRGRSRGPTARLQDDGDHVNSG